MSALLCGVLYLNISNLYPDSYYADNMILSKFRVHDSSKSSIGLETFHFEAISSLLIFKSFKDYPFNHSFLSLFDLFDNEWEKQSFSLRIYYIKQESLLLVHW